MGIFANRHIKKDEELTFNYNVDRYGSVKETSFSLPYSRTAVLHSHDAQPCYCGESNCVGFIGGKTQTDIAAMDDLYLDGEHSGLAYHVGGLNLAQHSVSLRRLRIWASKGTGRRRARSSTKTTSSVLLC